uniref:Uncharacterized protein n=1 Tax=Anguilla anguilla TaxID=7936 RepID=A0A0E9T001_ANGAN
MRTQSPMEHFFFLQLHIHQAVHFLFIFWSRIIIQSTKM